MNTADHAEEYQHSWVLHSPVFIGDIADPDRASSPWAGHRWFGYDLVRWLRPQKLVELGTHYGCSFFAFAQAVKEGHLTTECHAVDTWEGDPHAGYNGPDVHDSVTRIIGDWFDGVDITLHHGLFDDALKEFPDESIDLLHIDGFHSHEAVSYDFETWLPKVRPNGVVLLHHANPATGRGAADYWAELRREYPGFEFPHNFGLGVLVPKGTAAREFLLGDEMRRLRPYYTQRAGNELGKLRSRDQARMIAERDETAMDQARVIVERDETVLDQARVIVEGDETVLDQARIIDEQYGEIARQEALAEEHALRMARLDFRIAALFGRGSSRLKLLTKAAIKQAPGQIPTWARRARRRWWALVAGNDSVLDPSIPFDPIDDVVLASPSPADVAAVGERSLHRHPAFDASFYVAFNDDIALTTDTALDHYLAIGAYEGRPTRREAIAAGHERLNRPWRPETPQQSAMQLVQSMGEPQIIADPRAIDTSDFDLVTFDVWDTLLVRRRPAESVKLDTSRFLAQHPAFVGSGISGREFYTYRLDAERTLASERAGDDGWGEYTFRETLTAALERVVGAGTSNAIAALVDVAEQFEIKREIEYSDPNSLMLGWFDELASSGTAVALISDFYHTERALRMILAAAGIGADVPLFVSCDVGVSKAAGGRLLEFTRTYFLADASRHLHVGDNVHSDADMQIATGGRALVVPRPDPSSLVQPSGELQPDRLSKIFLEGMAAGAPQETRTHVNGITQWKDLQRFRIERAFRSGWDVAVLPTLVVLAAIEQAQQHGFSRVHYLSREGALLARVHNAVGDVVGAGDVVPGYLPSSGHATFEPSITDLDADLRRLSIFYGHQSPSELLEALGLDTEDYRSRLVAYGVAPDDRLLRMWEQPAFVAFMENPSVRRDVLRALRERRKYTREFLESQIGDEASVLVADLGWRGTIQDHLARIFPDRVFTGVYLALLPFINDQPDNVQKIAVAADGNAGDDVRWLENHVGAVEGLLAAPTGVVDGYAAGDRVILRGGSDRGSSLLASFQDGVIAGAATAAATYEALGCEVADLRNAAMESLRRLLLIPSQAAGDVFFSAYDGGNFAFDGATTLNQRREVIDRLVRAAADGSGPAGLDDLFWPAGLRRSWPVVAAQASWWG